MNEPIRTQWEIRCAFNAYCKRSLMNEKLVAHRDIKRRQLREVSFSDLTHRRKISFALMIHILQMTKLKNPFVWQEKK